MDLVVIHLRGFDVIFFGRAYDRSDERCVLNGTDLRMSTVVFRVRVTARLIIGFLNDECLKTQARKNDEIPIPNSLTCTVSLLAVSRLANSLDENKNNHQ
jgi:hypothetical protein